MHRFDFPYAIFFDGHRFLESFYVTNLEDKKRLETRLASFRNRVLIYPVVEVFDIEYFCEFFSHMKKNLIMQIVNNKLNTEFSAYEFKSAMFAKGGSDKDKQNYIFIAFNISKQLKAYVRYLDLLPYVIKGLYLASAETLRMAQHVIQSNKADKISNGFQIFTLECSPNYFRVVVLKQGSFALSRGITLSDRKREGLRAKEIADEIRNTIVYTLESYRMTSANVSLYCIVSKKSSALFTDMGLHVGAIFIYFLENSAETFKIKYDHEKHPIDNADILAAFFCLKTKPALQFNTKKTTTVNNLINLALLCDVCAVLFFFLSLAASLVLLTELGHEAIIARSLAKKDNVFHTTYKNLSSEYRTQSEDMSAIELVVKEYNTSLKHKDSVLNYTKTAAKLVETNKHIDILSLKLDKHNNSTLLVVDATLDLKGLSYQEAEAEYANLLKKVSEIFHKCKTTTSAIPIDINEKGIDTSFPIEIKAEGDCYAN